MMTLKALVKRNTSLFFKDKGMFFTALITPLILLVLYATFLSNVYEDTFRGIIEGMGFSVSDKIVGGCVGGQLMSSLLAVSCITVAFCSNLLSVQDKVTGARKDIAVSPVKASVLSLSYYISTFFSTLIICVVALVACLLYMVNVGWFLGVSDIILLVSDVFLLSLFGTALSSVVNYFLSTQGQISAVGSIVSSCYGFICGAYMPISSFSEGLRNVLSFLPGTHATSLIRNHSLKGVFTEMENINLPAELINGIKDAVDCNIYFFDEKVSISVMYAVIGVTISILMVIYILMNKIKKTA